MKILIRTVTDIYISDLKDVMAAKADIQVLYFISHENLPFIKYKCKCMERITTLNHNVVCKILLKPSFIHSSTKTQRGL